MSRNQETASATIDASAEKIYAIISDYENHHPHILPEAYFSGLDVLEGGVGEGTRINVHAIVYGSDQTMEMAVTEPHPGRVLTEAAVHEGMKTTFALEPVSDQQTEVTITTEWPPASGLQALFNRLVLPRYVRRMLEAELEQLARYVDEINGR
jgi:hypothetical protein